MQPVLLTFRLGGADVVLGAYGTFYVLAWVVALALATTVAWRRGLSWRRSLLLYGIALVVGIVGARLLDIATNWGIYAADPGQIYSLQFRGFSLYGGLVLALVTGALLARPFRLPVWRLADSAVPAIAAGIVLMRVGCYLRGCCFGTVTSVPWGVTFPAGSPAWTWQLVSGDGGVQGLTGAVRPVHPTQIYEMVAAIILAAIATVLMLRGGGAGRDRDGEGGPVRDRDDGGGAAHLREGVPFLVFALGFTLFRFAELYLRPRALTATEPVWFYPLLYVLILAGVTVITLRRAVSAPDDA